MLENSNLFSFYGANWKSNIERMLINPESTLKQLSKNGPALPNLREFQIHIVSKRTSENNKKTNLSEKLSITLLEYQGVQVSFNSVLDF